MKKHLSKINRLNFKRKLEKLPPSSLIWVVVVASESFKDFKKQLRLDLTKH